MKSNIFLVAICGLAAGSLVWGYVQNRSSYQNELLVILYQGENRLLKDQCRDLEYKLMEANGRPTFEDGQRDSIIRIGGPSTPGSYRDGYEAAMKVLGTNDYAAGYHAAIEQFGYKTDLYLIAKPGTDSRYTDINVTGSISDKKEEKEEKRVDKK